MNDLQTLSLTHSTPQNQADQQKINPAPGAPLTPAAQALAYLNSMSHKTPREVYQDLRDILSQEPAKNPLLAEDERGSVVMDYEELERRVERLESIVFRLGYPETKPAQEPRRVMASELSITDVNLMFKLAHPGAKNRSLNEYVNLIGTIKVLDPDDADAPARLDFSEDSWVWLSSDSVLEAVYS